MKPSPCRPDNEAVYIAAEAAEEAAHRAWGSGDLKIAFDEFCVGAALGWHGCMMNPGYF